MCRDTVKGLRVPAWGWPYALIYLLNTYFGSVAGKISTLELVHASLVVAPGSANGVTERFNW